MIRLGEPCPEAIQPKPGAWGDILLGSRDSISVLDWSFLSCSAQVPEGFPGPEGAGLYMRGDSNKQAVGGLTRQLACQVVGPTLTTSDLQTLTVLLPVLWG